MSNRITLAAALLMSTSAAAETVPYPNPVLTEHGLVLFVNDRARPAYRPLDGVDQWLSGKGSHLRVAESVDWSRAADAPKTRQTRHSRPDFPLPRIPGNSPACERADDRPTFCDRHDPDPVPHAPVPIPAAVWMLLAAVGGLIIQGNPKRRSARLQSGRRPKRLSPTL